MCFTKHPFTYFSEREHWHTAGEKIQEEKKRLEHQKEQDDVKIKEYYVSSDPIFMGLGAKNDKFHMRRQGFPTSFLLWALSSPEKLFLKVGLFYKK